MKARRIRETRRLNHEYSDAAKREAEAGGNVYTVPRYIDNPVGEIVEGPLVWSLCCPGHANAPPVCEPADEACQAKVDHWMQVERPRAIAAIREMAKPENLAKMNKKAQKEIAELATAYRDEPAAPVAPATKQTTKSAEVTE